ncbi:MAG: sulfurtransferase-like selenium metabolism protein YedF [Eubacteriales bacterium]|nr:sulfurtransferase-like selenium metabolism protein YedF [Eubacteriales bacterium]
MIKVNAIGDACPIPVVKTIQAIKEMKAPEDVEVLVDNEIAVQNLTRLAKQRNYQVKSEKIEEKKYRVVMSVGELPELTENTGETEASCIPDARRQNKVVVISSDCMGTGDDTLGAVLMKGFIYALTQQEELPSTILFYNGGARLTCEEAPTLEDLKSMEAQGVEILTCGTCLNHYGLADKLKVGSVTNMYVITEKMTNAGLIIRP